MKFKALIIILILSMIQGYAFAEGENEEKTDDFSVMFYDDFEYYTSGSPAGYSIGNKKIAQPYRSKDEQNRCVKLISVEELYDASLLKYLDSPVSEGSIYAHAKIKPTSVNSKRGLFNFRDTANKECQVISFDSDGFIKTGTGKILKPYRVNVWYDLTVKINMTDHVFDLWIDGKHELEAEPLQNQESLNIYFFKFGQFERMNYYCYFDDLYAYKADKIIDKQDIKNKYEVKFKDLYGSWAKSYIDNFANLHILSRTEDGNFYPEKNATRREFTIWYFNVNGLSTSNYAGECIDVEATDELGGMIETMVQAGLSGRYPGMWYPENDITVQEVCEFLIEGYKYNKHCLPGEPEMKFKNSQEKGEFARNYLLQADTLKLFEGVPNISLAVGNGDKKITKAQLVRVLYNYRKLVR